MPSNYNGKGKVVFNIVPDAKGIFLKRINRFLGEVIINGERELAHIHDPGRLEELLYKNNRVLLKKYNKEGRKTQWEIISAYYKKKWVFINSKFHRIISENILRDEEISPFGNIEEIKPEVYAGKSRIDYLLKDARGNIWVEVKGCTLEREGIALFPDAPTERGRRHIEELKNLVLKGDRASLLILIFHPEVKCFAPNKERDPKFANSYFEAINYGVEVHPAILEYNAKSVIFKGYTNLC
jgi:sugar fermentation stimulation protein A